MSKDNKKEARKSSPKVTVEETKESLTSQAGLVSVIKFLEKVGLSSMIKKTVDYKRGANAEYDLSDAVYLTVLGIIGGARCISGIISVWRDKVLRRIAGWFSIPVDTTLSRIYKGIRDGNIGELEAVNHQMRGRIWKMALRAGRSKVRALRNLWVDGDSTVKTVYGRQEGAEKAYNTQKRGALSYHPLIAFCSHTKEILQGWFRCGSAYTSNGVVEFMKQLLAHLSNGVRIVFRADSGFFSGELLEFLEERGHGYLIKVKMKGLIGILERQEWRGVEGQEGWEESEFMYGCGVWNKERRFVAVRVERQEQESEQKMRLFNMKSYDYFCYVTSEGLSPWQSHKKYGERATCETWIEEAKNQMALCNIKTDDFLANAALFQSAILAYNTVKWMALLSGDATLLRWEIQTVRAFLIRVAGKLITGSRQHRLKVSGQHLYPNQWEAWLAVGLA